MIERALYKLFAIVISFTMFEMAEMTYERTITFDPILFILMLGLLFWCLLVLEVTRD